MIKAIIGVIAVLVLIMVGVIFFQNRPAQTNLIPPAPTTAPAIQSLDAITENPDSFLGQQVTVQGDVDNILGRNTFVLDVPGEAVDDEILVVSTSAIPSSVEEAQNLFSGKQVRLTGMVNTFMYTQYVDSLDPNITPDLVSAYEGRPFIMTDMIEVVQ